MVFCGKASLSCQNCRIRRIKCNRLQPECSQCTRAGKKCPGYRDQLSLMFRDETVKVKSKFQKVDSDAAEGTASSSTPVDTPTSEGPATTTGMTWVEPTFVVSFTEAEPKSTASETGGESSTSTSKSAGTSQSKKPSRRRTSETLATTTRRQQRQYHQKQQQLQLQQHHHQQQEQQPLVLIHDLQPTLTDRGLKFYIDHYLFGHPDEPPGLDYLTVDQPWLFHSPAQTIASAVGLAGMANLTGDQQLRMESWQHYVKGMRLIGASLANLQGQDMIAIVRSVVLLAIFEIVRGPNLSGGSANTHVIGATALMNSYLPALPPDVQPFRGLMQFVFSQCFTFYAVGVPVPESALASANAAAPFLLEEDKPAQELLMMTADFLDLSSYTRRHALVDGSRQVADLLVQCQHLDARFAAWERNSVTAPSWQYTVGETKLPPKACYRGRFQIYLDTGTARLWSYYRWARILLNELYLDLLAQHPQTASETVVVPEHSDQFGAVQVVQVDVSEDGSPKKAGTPIKAEPGEFDSSNTTNKSGIDRVQQLQQIILTNVRRLAEDTLDSVPTFWRHPQLSSEEYKKIASPVPNLTGKGGAGAIGVAPVLFHLQVAGCSPGMPYEGWRWALSTMEAIWAVLGMEQARSLVELMRNHEGRVAKPVGA